MDAHEKFATMQKLKAQMEQSDAHKANHNSRNDGMSQSQIRFAEMSIEIEEIKKKLKTE